MFERQAWLQDLIDWLDAWFQQVVDYLNPFHLIFQLIGYMADALPDPMQGIPQTFLDIAYGIGVVLRYISWLDWFVNLDVLLALLFAFPIVQYLRRRYHEQQRWASSDYGPQDDD